MMMSYEQFKEVVTHDFTNYVPEKYKDYALEIRPVNKTNEVKDSLTLRKAEEQGAFPTIYINDMYDAYRQSRDFEATLQYFAEMMVKVLESPKVSAMKLDFDTAKDNIVFQLINTEQNKELLAEVPHRSFLDLSIVYRWLVTLPDDEQGMQSILIKNDTAERLGLTEEQLYNLAVRNTVQLLPPQQVLVMPNMYVVTNKYHIYGAETVLYEQVLYDLSRRVGGSLCVLPSSVHEWIVMPAMLIEFDLDCMSEMVYKINMTQLDLDERLSNQVYFYNPEERQVKLVTDTANKRLDGKLA